MSMRDAVNEVYEFVALMSDNEWHYLGKDTSQYSAEKQAKEIAEHMGLTVKKVITNDEFAKIIRAERIEELTDMLPDAINTIKELCGLFEDCRECPLNKSGGCGVERSPYAWKFGESEDEEDG